MIIFFFLVTDIYRLFNLCGVYWNNNYYSPQCCWIVYNYPPKGRSIVVDIYRDAKRRDIYPPLFTDPEGDSCFSIYQIRWIKKCFFNFFFWNFHKTTCHFSLCSQNSKYPRIFLEVTGANQNTQKLLSTDLVNTGTNIQLFPEGEVNSGGYIPRREASRYIRAENNSRSPDNVRPD